MTETLLRQKKSSKLPFSDVFESLHFPLCARAEAYDAHTVCCGAAVGSLSGGIFKAHAQPTPLGRY